MRDLIPGETVSLLGGPQCGAVVVLRPHRKHTHMAAPFIEFARDGETAWKYQWYGQLDSKGRPLFEYQGVGAASA